MYFVESTDSEFDSSEPGTHVYEPVIPVDYEIDMDIELSRITINVKYNETMHILSFEDMSNEMNDGNDEYNPDTGSYSFTPCAAGRL